MERELEAYLSAMQATVRRQEVDVAAMQASVDEVARVRELLTRLPDKVRHKAMVPYGKHAFFEGELVHTNDLLVGLGCDYQLEASAREAAAVLERRQARAAAALSQAQAQLEDLRAQVRTLQTTFSNEDGEAFMEIRQEYEESEELLRSAREAGGARSGAPPSPSLPSSTSAAAGGSARAAAPGPSAGRQAAPAAGHVRGGSTSASLRQSDGGFKEPGPGRDMGAGAGGASRGAGGATSGAGAGGGAGGGNGSSGAAAGAAVGGGAARGSAGGAPDGADDDMDRRIFARLAELEALEAEAGSGAGSSTAGSGDEGDGAGAGEPGAAAKGCAPGALSSGSAAAPRAGADTHNARQEGAGGSSSSSSSGGGGGDMSAGGSIGPVGSAATHAAPAKAGSGPAGKPVPGAGLALKKGFLLGSGGGRASKQPKPGGATAPAGPATAPAVGTTPGSVPRATGCVGIPAPVGASPGPDEVDASGGTDVAGASGRSEGLGGGSGGAAAGSVAVAERPRRVSFVDGSVPGLVEDGRGAQGGLVVSGNTPSVGQAVGSAGSAVRPVLKQGGGNDAVGGQPGALDRGASRASPGGWAVGRVAGLEDGGDASMAMARAREEAFTGMVRERVAEEEKEEEATAGAAGRASAAGGGAGAGKVGVAAIQHEEAPQPKRVSKFKQRRVAAT